MNVACIVLAAGASTRMGTNKMLLELEGEPIVHRAARCALEGNLHPVIVVLGHEPDAARAALGELPLEVVINPYFTGPTAGSLHRGLSRLDPDVQAVVILLADMVLVGPEMIHALIATLAQSTAPAVGSRYGNVIAPPFAFRRSLFNELLGSTGAGVGRAALERHQDIVRLVDWPPDRLVDIDTPADFEVIAGRARDVE